jgi:hypothetical protein
LLVVLGLDLIVLVTVVVEEVTGEVAFEFRDSPEPLLVVLVIDTV